MIYHIFRYFPSVRAYRLSDRDASGDTFEHAARTWAEGWARPSESSLDLLVARFSNNIVSELRRVQLKRQPNPWTVVNQSDWDNCNDEEDD